MGLRAELRIGLDVGSVSVVDPSLQVLFSLEDTRFTPLVLGEVFDASLVGNENICAYFCCSSPVQDF